MPRKDPGKIHIVTYLHKRTWCGIGVSRTLKVAIVVGTITSKVLSPHVTCERCLACAT